MNNDNDLFVGSMVRCNVNFPSINVKAGMIGFVVEEYRLGKNEPKGVTIIFESGGYDGFSKEEQDKYISFIEHYEKYTDYEFVHVGKLQQDFQKGYWKFHEK